MQSFLNTVRRSCSAAVWSQGVELSRAGAVVEERAGEDEVELRVSSPGYLVAPTVFLWPQEADWSCDCVSSSVREAVCAHVAAAVIALNRARQGGPSLAKVQASMAHVAYRFYRLRGGLGLERYEANAGHEKRLVTSLTAVTQHNAASRDAWAVTPMDLGIDRLLARYGSGPLPGGLMPKVLAALVDSPHVSLDGKPIGVGPAQSVLWGVLQARDVGAWLSVQQHPDVVEIFANGAVLWKDKLRAMAESRLHAREIEALGKGRYFTPQALAHWIANAWPALSQQIAVTAQGLVLPKVVKMHPRVVIDSQQEGPVLHLLANLVYGDPVCARILGDHLQHVGGSLPLRDTHAEERLKQKLKHDVGLDIGHKSAWTGVQALEIADRLRRWQGGTLCGQGHASFFKTAPLKPRFKTDGLDFELFFETHKTQDSSLGMPTPAKKCTVDAATVLRAWQQGQPLVPLLEGGWAPVPLHFLETHGHRMEALLEARGAPGPLPGYAALDMARLCDALDEPKPPSLARLEAAYRGFTSMPEMPLPADLQAHLRSYQRQGVCWLLFLRNVGLGGLLADDMGLGKTLQALCILPSHSQGRSLVVAPTSVLHNWADEIQRFRPSLRCTSFHGSSRQWDPQADVILTSYALLRRDIDLLASQRWQTVVLDEAQAIKNPESQVAQAAYRLDAEFRVALTGTPVENRLDELWSQLHFLNPGLLGGRQAFQDRYAKPITDGQAGAAAQLQERIRPFILRRLKQEVAPELPPRTDMVLRCTLTPPERSLYDAVYAATRAEVVARLDTDRNVLAALEALLRLRQACCHGGLLPGGLLPGQQASSSSKLDVLVAALLELVAEGHKALVFSQWTALLDLVEPQLRAHALAFTRLDGRTSDRSAVVAQFQRPQGPPIMLISLKAGGTGLNLTAADHVFLLDPWWNPAAEDQAADRTHRIGQNRPVFVYRLVAEDTVEERILALQATKRAAAAAALEGSDRAGSLTREDLRMLLE